MKRASIILAVATALLTSSLFAAAPTTYAAEDNENITLTPAVSRPTLDAGQRLSGKMTVINNGKSAYTFLVYARPYSVKGEQYDPNYTVVNEKTEAYQWVEFAQTEYRLDAGQSVDVPYTVTVPANAASGGHYAVLFAETQPDDATSSNVIRKKRVGSLLYMTVNGTVTQAGSLESWDVKTWQTSLPLVSTIRLKNSGNTHFQADVQVRYSNILGKKRFEFNKQLLILPGTTRRIPVEWGNAPLFGFYKASGTVHFLDKSETLPARYIVLLPLRVLATAFSLLLAAGAGAVLLKRRRAGPRTPTSP